MSHLAKTSLIVLSLISALTLALLSVHIERLGPEVSQYGNLCVPGSSDPCYQPVLKGGFPVAYLFDAPGVSVEHQLAFMEDKLFAGALALDIALYFAFVSLVIAVVARRRSRFDRHAG